MGFILTSYNELKAKYNKEVLVLRAKHNAASISQLKPHRRCQVQFLYKQIELLDKSMSSDNEKARIFSGLLYILADEIDKTSGAGSLFKKSLLAVLGVREEDKEEKIAANHLDANSIARMVNAALNFCTSFLFENGDSTRPMLERHPFYRIKEFDIIGFVIRGHEIEKNARNDIITEAYTKLQKEIKEREEARRGPSTYQLAVNYFWGSNSKEAEDEIISNEIEGPGYYNTETNPY